MTHPHLLSQRELWFINTFFFYFLQASIIVGTFFYDTALVLPPFTDFEPDELLVKKIILFIVDDLPSIVDLIWVFINFDLFIKELIFLFSPPFTERKIRTFIDR
jgi:hypothetical protein